MQKKYLSKNEINQLKSDLLMKKKSNYRKTLSSSISQEFYKNQNKEIGITLEDNIRNILTIYYQWQKVPINRKFVYCEITIDKKTDIITNLNPEEILINGKIVTFKINTDKSLDIEANGVTNKIKSQQQIKYKIFEKEIIIENRKEIEIDGIYKNFNFEKFDKNEITYLYKNIHNMEITSFDKVILEIKLNKSKIDELLIQLLRDKKFLEKVSDDNILYLGIINSKTVNFEIISNFKKDHEDLNFIIIGIKDSKLCKKDLNKNHDWDEILKLQKVTKTLEDVMRRLQSVEEELKNKKDMEKLTKKRKRDKSNSDDSDLDEGK